MQKTIIVCGYGQGISDAVANKFGGEGSHVALVATSADKLDKAPGALQARGVKAAAFPIDLSDPHAAKGLVKRMTDQLGPVTAIHWNAYAHLAGDVMAADATALRTVFEVSVTSLVLTVQKALAYLKGSKGGVLGTNAAGRQAPVALGLPSESHVTPPGAISVPRRGRVSRGRDSVRQHRE